MAKTKPISPPLPLPVRFALLPSLLPSKPLVPLLFSKINGLPVYITLSPSHAPHLSLLPLALALSLPPLNIIKQLPLGCVSLDLAGEAPFVDVWVPVPVAKLLCETLGVGHLVGVGRTGAGLLCDEVEQMISWEEDGGFCHNWTPATMPLSTYSLDTLLATPFGRVEVIPDERCITTPMGRDRKASLVAGGEFDNPSRIRHGDWWSAWEELLPWTIHAWADFSAYPSRPSQSRSSQTAESIHRLLSRLSHSPNTARHLDHPISAADIDAALLLGAVHDPSIPQLLHQIFLRLYLRLPFVSVPERSYGSRKRLECRARVQLGIVEMVGFQMVDTFSRARGGLEVPESDSTHDIPHSHHRQRYDSGSIGGPSHTDTVLDTEPLLIQPPPSSHALRRPDTRKRRTATTVQDTSAILRSEAVEGWWLYSSVAGAIIVAIVFGVLPN